MQAQRHPVRPAILVARRSAWMACACLAATAAAQSVRELGPAPISNGGYTGRVSAIACDPTDANRFFVSGADGGVWRTTNGGASWTPLTDQMPTTAMGALAIDPTNPDVIYAGTGEANFANHSRYGLGIYKSTDGGDTWSHLAEATFAGRCFSKIIVSPDDPQTLFASVTIAGGFPTLAAAKGHPQANGPVGVFHSTDGGESWTQLLNGLPNLSATDLAMDPSNPNVLYAAIGHIFGNTQNGIYKTTNGGVSWSKLTGGLPTSSVGRISLAVAPSDPARVYTLITRNCDASGNNASTLGGYRSDNGGTSWTNLSVPSIQATYGWYLSVVVVSPTNSSVVFMGGLNLVRSQNAGASWIDRTPPHVDLHALTFDASGRLLCGDDGGVHTTTSLGNSWSSVNAGLGVIQFYAGLSMHPTDEDVFFGGTQDNGTNRRLTDSLDWQGVIGGDGGWTQIDPVNPSIVFGEYQGSGNLYRSTNGGGSFSFAGNGINGGDRNCFEPPYLIDPTNSSRLLYATHRIYRSTNGGTSWSALSGDLSNGSGAVRALAQAASDPMYVYAATNDGNVQRSIDGGANFTLVRSGVPGWPRVTRELAVAPDDPQTVYLAVASFGADQVLRSTDAGANWTALDGDLPDVPVNVVATDVRTHPPTLFAGTDQGLFRSRTDGASWSRFGEGLPHAAIIDLQVDEGRDRLLVGTQGRGAWLVSIPPGSPADLDGDGDVDLQDLSILLADYGCTSGDCVGDINGDGTTDLSDLSILLADYGT